MTTEETQQSQPTYTHSLKLESTQKGVRIHTHIYGMSVEQVTEESIKLYLSSKTRLESEGIQLAPMNGGKE